MPVTSNCPLHGEPQGIPVSRCHFHPQPVPLPSPTYLIGLEIIVQRKLQFAQVLWLFLLLAFTFSFRQPRLCIIIILREL